MARTPKRSKLALDEEIKTLRQIIPIIRSKIKNPGGPAKGLEFLVTGPKPINPNYKQRVYGKLRFVMGFDQEYMEELLPVLERQLERLEKQQMDEGGAPVES